MTLVSRWQVWLTLIVLACLGCADNSIGIVSGEVKIDGSPASSGSISFYPLDGKSQTAGAVITDGKYETKVPIGKCRVEIRASREIGKKKIYDTPDSPIQSIMEEMLPPKYNDQSELSYEVTPGKNAPQNYDLESMPAAKKRR